MRFLTSHGRVLLCIARDPGVRLRDVAARLGITERSAHAIVGDLVAAGYVVKHKHGRRNRYQIQAHLPLPEPASQESALGDVLAILIGDGTGQNLRDSAPGQEHASISDSDLDQSPVTSYQPGRSCLMAQVARRSVAPPGLSASPASASDGRSPA